MPSRIKRILLVASAIAAVLLLLMTIVGGWRYDSWSFGRWASVEVGLGGGRVEFGITRRYELSLAYRAGQRQGQPEDFALDSTGRLLDPWEYFKPDSPIRHSGYYNGDGWVPRFDWATRLEVESFDGVNGGYAGPTDWTRSFDVAIPLVLLAGIAGLPA